MKEVEPSSHGYGHLKMGWFAPLTALQAVVVHDGLCVLGAATVRSLFYL